jgi:hypothetical protein
MVIAMLASLTRQGFFTGVTTEEGPTSCRPALQHSEEARGLP